MERGAEEQVAELMGFSAPGAERKTEAVVSLVPRLPTHDEIAERAKQIWLERGGMPGSDVECWLEAELQLKDRGVTK